MPSHFAVHAFQPSPYVIAFVRNTLLFHINIIYSAFELHCQSGSEFYLSSEPHPDGRNIKIVRRNIASPHSHSPLDSSSVFILHPPQTLSLIIPQLRTGRPVFRLMTAASAVRPGPEPRSRRLPHSAHRPTASALPPACPRFSPRSSPGQ